MERIQRFKNLESHPWFKKVFAKLKKEDVHFCEAFLIETKDLNNDLYAKKTVRLWLDKKKPKNWKHIEELLIASL